MPLPRNRMAFQQAIGIRRAMTIVMAWNDSRLWKWHAFCDMLYPVRTLFGEVFMLHNRNSTTALNSKAERVSYTRRESCYKQNN